MDIIVIVIALFILLESLNVLTLYFNPGSQMSNGVGVFDAWERSKADPVMHQFIRYLVYWVAGTKLIFIALLLVILLTGNEITKQLTALALIVSIASFFWRLYPIIRSLDKQNHITLPGYSKTLGVMIAVFIGTFVMALIGSVMF